MYRFTYKEVNFYKATIEQLIEKSMESLSENKRVIVLSGSEDNSKKLVSLFGETRYSF